MIRQTILLVQVYIPANVWFRKFCTEQAMSALNCRSRSDRPYWWYRSTYLVMSGVGSSVLSRLCLPSIVVSIRQSILLVQVYIPGNVWCRKFCTELAMSALCCRSWSDRPYCWYRSTYLVMSGWGRSALRWLCLPSVQTELALCSDWAGYVSPLL